MFEYTNYTRCPPDNSNSLPNSRLHSVNHSIRTCHTPRLRNTSDFPYIGPSCCVGRSSFHNLGPFLRSFGLYCSGAFLWAMPLTSGTMELFARRSRYSGRAWNRRSCCVGSNVGSSRSKSHWAPDSSRSRCMGRGSRSICSGTSASLMDTSRILEIPLCFVSATERRKGEF